MPMGPSILRLVSHSVVLLRSFAFELLMEANIILAFISPGTALVSSSALVVFRLSFLKDGAL
jgi:hypothetical protein